MNARSLLIALVASALASFAGASGSEPTLTINPAEKHQVMEGFGTCLVTWKPAVVAKYDEQFPQFYLGTLGASVLRIDLWCDSAPTVHERWQDISWREFTFEGKGARGKVFVDVARRLQAASDGRLRVIATAWSPPGWMKISGSSVNEHPERKAYGIDLRNPGERGHWNGPLEGQDGEERFRYVGQNKLRPDRYPHFAKLLVEWTRYFRSLGIELYAISAQNELMFSHYFDSCIYTPEEYAELLRVIAWMFAHEQERQPPMFGPEHMTFDIESNRQYLEALAARPAAFASLGAIASHGYIDGYAADRRPDSVSAFRELARPYGKKIWMTEGSTGRHEWPAPIHEAGAAFLNAVTAGGVSLIAPWQVIDDRPNEHGLATIEGPTKKTSVATHFFRFIRPGMVRIGISGEALPFGSAAFQDPSSARIVLVLLNRTPAAASCALASAQGGALTIAQAYLTDADRDCAAIDAWVGQGRVELPAESIATLVLTPRD